MKKLALPLAVSAVMGLAGLALVKDSEGLRHTPYKDPVNIVTVCYGHTGNDIVWGKYYSDDECNTLLFRDVLSHQAGIKQCIASPLNQNQLDAVTSFSFNVGVRATCSSTLARKLRTQDYYGASLEFNKWVYAGGKRLPGLVTRRARETKLFNAPVAYSGLPVSLGNTAWATTGATGP